ncbi:hypothetical protein SteCoe_1549 [Stentor coeruleus]|uniref:Uncharacterized protein n=1 Tax=Stentor coeruleus TaxID=5963 RepID=A0A1R2D1Q7_9CILI|nr:hypothetical protein SteCoe_1549 [Stentor coeruleus]
MLSLQRTFAGKTSHYSPDGYGRDWYILHDNGGVYKKACVTGFGKEKKQVAREYSPPQPRMDAKFIRYSSDGSGRDAYINCNSGGLISPYKSKPFRTTLREWSPIKLIDTSDMFYRSQQMWMKRRARKNSAQGELSSRLSVPKRREVISPVKTSSTSKRVPYPKTAAE